MGLTEPLLALIGLLILSVLAVAVVAAIILAPLSDYLFDSED